MQTINESLIEKVVANQSFVNYGIIVHDGKIQTSKSFADNNGKNRTAKYVVVSFYAYDAVKEITLPNGRKVKRFNAKLGKFEKTAVSEFEPAFKYIEQAILAKDYVVTNERNDDKGNPTLDADLNAAQSLKICTFPCPTHYLTDKDGKRMTRKDGSLITSENIRVFVEEEADSAYVCYTKALKNARVAENLVLEEDVPAKAMGENKNFDEEKV